ncbi:MAG: hypothetical protein AMXMBFR34_13700 [Myxococcaceae bacterium]
MMKTISPVCTRATSATTRSATVRGSTPVVGLTGDPAHANEDSNRQQDEPTPKARRPMAPPGEIGASLGVALP